jgi:hypothetical protein
LIEPTHVRRRHLHGTHRDRLTRQLQGRCRGRTGGRLPPHTHQDRLDVEARLGLALLDGPLHLLLGVLLQQLHHADVMLGPVARSMLPLQSFTQLVEHGRQLPAAKNVGMVHGRRPTVQPLQIVLRIEHLLVPAVTARVRRDHLPAQHDLDPLHVGLDRHGLEGSLPGHAVAVGLVADRLVLIDLGRRADTGIEGSFRQGQRLGTLPCEALADALALACLDALSVTHTTALQMNIQSGQVLRPRHRRGPVALQMPHTSFDVWLLLRLTHPAEQCLEAVVAGQGLVTLVQLPFTAGQHLTHHGFGVVPPHFARHAAEELKSLDHAVQDRLGTLAGQRDGKRTIRVSPGEQQHRHLPAAVREIDVDVAEVRLQALTRVVVQRDKGLPLAVLLPADVEPYALVAATVGVLALQTAKNLGRRVPLLARRLFVRLQQGVDHRLERIEDRWQRATLIRFGFGLGEDLTDFAARVMKVPRQLADTHLVHAMGASDTCIFVHSDHPPPPCSWTPLWCTSLQEVVEGGTVFDEHFSRGVGPFSMRITSH